MYLSNLETATCVRVRFVILTFKHDRQTLCYLRDRCTHLVYGLMNVDVPLKSYSNFLVRYYGDVAVDYSHNS